MTTQRQRILDDVKSTLELIDGTGDYSTAFTTVEPGILPVSAVGADQMPFACYDPIGRAPRSPDASNEEEIKEQILIVAHLRVSDASLSDGDRAANHRLRQVIASEALADIAYALNIDPGRGTNGNLPNATQTIITAHQTTEANFDGTRGRKGAVVSVFVFVEITRQSSRETRET